VRAKKVVSTTSHARESTQSTDEHPKDSKVKNFIHLGGALSTAMGI